MTKKERISGKAKEILATEPAGVRWSHLVSRLRDEFPEDPLGTITGSSWNLDARFPDEVYKPSRGLFRLLKFKADPMPTLSVPAIGDSTQSGGVREADFYQPFADYLVNDLEECTAAISLGGNRFGSKWGTPDVFGIFKSRESDIVKMPLLVVAAEVKTDTGQLITAFGQSCAYKLFAHRSYLVIPNRSLPEDISRLDALCVIFGIGLILFNSEAPTAPDFEIRVRAARHEPDAFYVNQCVRQIADELHL